MAVAGQSYTIGGVKIQFPCKAYPSQLSMMDKIVKGIERCQNSLLESPTGSGKSLALLCSALAWQAAEYEKAQEEEDNEKDANCKCQCGETERSKSDVSPYFSKTDTPANAQISSKVTAVSSGQVNKDISPAPSGQVLGAQVSQNSGQVTNSLLTLPGGQVILNKTPATSGQIIVQQNPVPSGQVVGNAVPANNTILILGNKVPSAGGPVIIQRLPSPSGQIIINNAPVAPGQLVSNPAPGTKLVLLNNQVPVSGQLIVQKIPVVNSGQVIPVSGGSVVLNSGQTVIRNTPAVSGQSLINKIPAAAGQQVLLSGNTVDTNGQPQMTPAVKAAKSERDADGDDDFKPTAKKFRTPGGPQKSAAESPSSASPVQWQMQLNNPSSSPDVSTGCCTCQSTDSGKTKSRKVPKIYFGTRTHKQITQISRELGKTAYRNVRMTILASREHTCVDPEVSRMPKKNEECKNKLDGPGCRFHDNVRKICTQRSLQSHYGLSSAWDIEDLVQVCKSKAKACPYFASRQLKDSADIVFCPYNYLIDPVIRNSMEISLKDQVVILDEAHNIEDSAREAASYSVSQKDLQDVSYDINKMIQYNIKPTDHIILGNLISSIDTWITRQSADLSQNDWEQSSRVWSGIDFVAMLKTIKAGPDEFQSLLKHLRNVCESEEGEGFKGFRDSELKLKSASMSVLEHLFIIFGFLYKDNLKFMPDYRIAVVKLMTYEDRPTDNMWLSKRYRAHREPSYTYTLNFWCLNPAVAFTELDDTRSVIVTSGTLSPMTSFQSELGVPFPIQLEANHVVGNSQVWVGTVGRGPSGSSLLANYNNAETFTFQDEVGSVVYGVCQTVPHGVLCFLPSYKLLQKLATRWKNTGLWERIERHKTILSEPRGSDKENFEEQISQYYEVIKDSENSENGQCSSGVNGALFLAVCRGKVSEGLDFADNNARAVITVGIPFPNVKDIQVDQKKRYNTQHCSSRGLLNGSDWYEIQAYRALNQALGRCIRHRHDWGALVLLDERYSKNPQKYIKGLSKWVRQKVNHYPNYSDAMASLENFTQGRLKVAVPDPGTPSQFQSPFAQKSPATKDLISPLAKQYASNDTSLLDSPSAAFLKSTTSDTKLTPYQQIMPLSVCNTNTQANQKNAQKAEDLFSTGEIDWTRKTTPSANPNTSKIQRGTDDSAKYNNISGQMTPVSVKSGARVEETPTQADTSMKTPKCKLELDKNDTGTDLSTTVIDSEAENRLVHGRRNKRNMGRRKGNVKCNSRIAYEDEDSNDFKEQTVTPKKDTAKPKCGSSLKDKLLKFANPKTVKTKEHSGVSEGATVGKSAVENLTEDTDIVKHMEKTSSEHTAENKTIESEMKLVKREATPPLYDTDTEAESEPMTLTPDEAAFDAVAEQILQKQGVTVSLKQNKTSKNQSETVQSDLEHNKDLGKSGGFSPKHIKQESIVKEISNDKHLDKLHKATEEATIKTVKQELKPEDPTTEPEARETHKPLFRSRRHTSSNKVKNEDIQTVENEKAGKNDLQVEAESKEDVTESVGLVRRTKRRRSLTRSSTTSSKRSRGKDLVDQIQPERLAACRLCTTPFIKSTDGVTECKDYPSFLNTLSKALKIENPSVVTVNRSQLVNCQPATGVRLIRGLSYNCWWSEEDGCCIQYMICKNCSDKKTEFCIAGMQISAIRDNTSSFKPGEVYLLQK